MQPEYIRLLAVVTFVLGIAGIIAIPTSTVTLDDINITPKQYKEARVILSYCQSYALTHEGKFPSQLEDLFANSKNYHYLLTTKEGEDKWIYYPGGIHPNIPSSKKTLIIETVNQRTWKNKKVKFYGYSDGSVLFMNDKEYESHKNKSASNKTQQSNPLAAPQLRINENFNH